MGLQISCDFCGRELVYSKGWEYAENDHIRCAACSELVKMLICLDSKMQFLITFETVIGPKDTRYELIKALQNHCKGLTDGLSYLMDIDHPII